MPIMQECPNDIRKIMVGFFDEFSYNVNYVYVFEDLGQFPSTLRRSKEIFFIATKEWISVVLLQKIIIKVY